MKKLTNWVKEALTFTYLAALLLVVLAFWLPAVVAGFFIEILKDGVKYGGVLLNSLLDSAIESSQRLMLKEAV